MSSLFETQQQQQQQPQPHRNTTNPMPMLKRSSSSGETATLDSHHAMIDSQNFYHPQPQSQAQSLVQLPEYFKPAPAKAVSANLGDFSATNWSTDFTVNSNQRSNSMSNQLTQSQSQSQQNYQSQAARNNSVPSRYPGPEQPSPSASNSSSNVNSFNSPEVLLHNSSAPKNIMSQFNVPNISIPTHTGLFEIQSRAMNDSTNSPGTPNPSSSTAGPFASRSRNDSYPGSPYDTSDLETLSGLRMIQVMSGSNQQQQPSPLFTHDYSTPVSASPNEPIKINTQLRYGHVSRNPSLSYNSDSPGTLFSANSLSSGADGLDFMHDPYHANLPLTPLSGQSVTFDLNLAAPSPLTASFGPQAQQYDDSGYASFDLSDFSFKQQHTSYSPHLSPYPAPKKVDVNNSQSYQPATNQTSYSSSAPSAYYGELQQPFMQSSAQVSESLSKDRYDYQSQTQKSADSFDAPLTESSRDHFYDAELSSSPQFINSFSPAGDEELQLMQQYQEHIRSQHMLPQRPYSGQQNRLYQKSGSVSGSYQGGRVMSPSLSRSLSTSSPYGGPYAEKKPTYRGKAPPPLEALNAWQIFLKDHLDKAKKRDPKTFQKEMRAHAHEAARKYAELPPAHLSAYEQRAQISRDIYERDRAVYLESLNPSRFNVPASGGKGKVKRDPAAPRKPLTPFFLFLRAIRNNAELKESIWCGEADTRKQSSLASAQWKLMTDADKESYVAEANEEKDKYLQLKKEYDELAAVMRGDKP